MEEISLRLDQQAGPQKAVVFAAALAQAPSAVIHSEPITDDGNGECDGVNAGLNRRLVGVRTPSRRGTVLQYDIESICVEYLWVRNSASDHSSLLLVL